MRILFLDLDTLRPDHLGCYGYHRDTSPHIDSVAKDGVMFTNYFCSDAPCLPSRAALWSGRFGIHTGVVDQGGTAADMRLEGESRRLRDRMGFDSLPAILRQAGFRTVMVSPFAERHGAWWFYAAFNEMYNPGKGGAESAEDITPTVLDWIERNGSSDNWFLHVNYWDPHTPYRAPEEFGNPFANDPLPRWPTEEALARHREMVGPHGAREVAMYDNSTAPAFPRHPGEVEGVEGLRRVFDGYDCGIRYMDGHIGRIFAALEAQGVMNDLAIIITADHGENIGELGLYGEHATADIPTCRIPMILRWPGAKAGHVDSGFHYNLDLLPTLAELFERPAVARWDGRSFSEALQGEKCGRDHLILSQCAHVCQRSVRFGPWLYMRTCHDGYHLFPDEMLFDLETDPHEECSLAAEKPEVCEEAREKLAAWHEEMMSTMQGAPDPLDTVLCEGGPFHAKGRLKRYCEYLEATGRGWAIPELKKKHPGEFGA